MLVLSIRRLLICFLAGVMFVLPAVVSTAASAQDRGGEERTDATSSVDGRTPTEQVLTATEPESESGDDSQCSKPIEERVGGWACAGDAATSVADAPEEDASSSAAVAASNHCSGPACWHVDDAFYATAGMNCDFGYGTEVFGTTNLQGRYNLNGAQMRTKTWMSTDRRLVDVLASANLLYGALADPGTPVESELETAAVAYITSGFENAWYPWGTTGVTNYDNERARHSTRVAYVWSLNDYTYTWAASLKSSVADDFDDNGIYTFTQADRLFAESWTCRWVGG